MKLKLDINKKEPTLESQISERLKMIFALNKDIESVYVKPIWEILSEGNTLLGTQVKIHNKKYPKPYYERQFKVEIPVHYGELGMYCHFEQGQIITIKDIEEVGEDVFDLLDSGYISTV